MSRTPFSSVNRWQNPCCTCLPELWPTIARMFGQGPQLEGWPTTGMGEVDTKEQGLALTSALPFPVP